MLLHILVMNTSGTRRDARTFADEPFGSSAYDAKPTTRTSQGSKVRLRNSRLPSCDDGASRLEFSTMKRKASTAAQVRGDIDHGRAGDRAPALDPAAAPLETDAEAGGAPPTVDEIEQERTHTNRLEGDRRPNAVSPARTPDASADQGHHPFLTALALLVLTAAIVVGLILWLG